jgi:hypothetical protein
LSAAFAGVRWDDWDPVDASKPGVSELWATPLQQFGQTGFLKEQFKMITANQLK